MRTNRNPQIDPIVFGWTIIKLKSENAISANDFSRPVHAIPSNLPLSRSAC